MSLPAGTAYKVEELEANKDGYTTTSRGDTGFIPANAYAAAEFVNNIPPTPGTTPNTGDDTYLMVWLALMGVSAAGILIAVLFGRKKKHEK